MKKFKLPLIGLLVASLLTIAFIGCKKDFKSPGVTSDAKGGVATSSTQYGQPTITCGDVTTTSIDIVFTAGTNGAPSGFSLQWMTAADYAQYGWPVGTDYDAETSVAPSFCKASFSGNAYASRYNLLHAGDQVTVTVGAFLFDNGASTLCPNELLPCTEYVFRAFSHGDNSMNRSIWSDNHSCTTACEVSCGHQGFGYWKNHCDLIPAGGLTLYGVSYTHDDLCTILNTQPSIVCTGSGKNKQCSANDLIIVGHQIIAAALNGFDLTGVDGTPSLQGQNFLTGYQPAGTYAGLIATLRHNNETCP
jgi:hypothetical protein